MQGVGVRHGSRARVRVKALEWNGVLWTGIFVSWGWMSKHKDEQKGESLMNRALNCVWVVGEALQELEGREGLVRYGGRKKSEMKLQVWRVWRGFQWE